MFGGLSKKETGLLVEFLKKINNFKKIDAVKRVIEDQKQVRKFFKDEKK